MFVWFSELQILRNEKASEKCDVYSFGVVCTCVVALWSGCLATHTNIPTYAKL